MVQVVEQVFIQAFILRPAVEVFDKPVLHWLAGRDVVPNNHAAFLPLQDRIGSQFGPIVANDHARVSAHLSGPAQLRCNTVTGQRHTDNCGKTFSPLLHPLLLLS